MMIIGVPFRLRIFKADIGDGHVAIAIFVGDRIAREGRFDILQMQNPDNWVIIDPIPNAKIATAIWRGETLRWNEKATSTASEQISLDYAWKIRERYIDIENTKTMQDEDSNILASFQIVKKYKCVIIRKNGHIIPRWIFDYKLERRIMMDPSFWIDEKSELGKTYCMVKEDFDELIHEQRKKTQDASLRARYTNPECTNSK